MTERDLMILNFALALAIAATIVVIYGGRRQLPKRVMVVAERTSILILCLVTPTILVMAFLMGPFSR